MSKTCIICLGDLEEGLADSSHPAVPDADGREDQEEQDHEAGSAAGALSDGWLPDAGELGHEIGSGVDTPNDGWPMDAELALPKTALAPTVAHLPSCCHDFHDECLRAWVERANSCPICRQDFNQVQLCHFVGGRSMREPWHAVIADFTRPRHFLLHRRR
jgi:hypothetical protein